MSPETWTAVDDLINSTLVRQDEALQKAIEDSLAAGLPAISVSPAQGKLLHILARIRGARRILEIGTLGGYSTIWLARALPDDGSLITLEIDPHHAEVARANVVRAGVGGKVEIIVGPALDSLAQLEGTFDLFFIDADKENIPRYFEESMRLSIPGSLIVVDNVVRKGQIVEASDDPNVAGVRKFMEIAGANPRIVATTVQTVGSKGYDGLAFAMVS